MSNLSTSIHDTHHMSPGLGRRFALGGGTVEVLLGLTAIVLAILALAGLVVVPLASIAVIATGAALVLEGASVARTATEAEVEGRPITTGIGADSVGGIAAIALGVLSLIGLDPTVLLPISAIVLGAGMLIASGALSFEREHGHHISEHVRATGAAGVRTLVGAGAIVLGIIGLVGNSPIMLTLVAMLSIGTGLLLSGATFSSRMGTLAHR
jgi:hypothetical protein